MIRRYHPKDRADLVDVCLRTGDGGHDGSALYSQQPELLADVFVLPYLEFCPDLALTLEMNGRARGYCLAALDSADFYRKVARDWLPRIRSKPRVSAATPALAELYRLIDDYEQRIAVYPPCLHAYPAHLHIDLHPLAQGSGQGRGMLLRQLDQLTNVRAPGVHLAMHPGNVRADAFYRRLGFRHLADPALPDDTRFMVKELRGEE